MSEQEFIAKMQDEVFYTEADITMDMQLADIEEWDSLGFVSFIAIAKEAGFNNVTRDAINQAKTVGDLYSLVK